MNRTAGILVVVAAVLAFSSCSNSPKQPIVEKDLTYGKGGDVDLKLDIALPARGRGPFPALVYIFGGGWGYYASNRAACPIEAAAARGYVAVTIDYRLTDVKENGKTKYLFPAQIYDVKAAIRWLRANAKKYRVDPARIGVVGFSSGGHLALLAGLTVPADGLEGEGGNDGYSSQVQAVVDMAGMVEATSFYRDTNVPERLALLVGGTPAEVPEQYKIVSPITYVRPGSPPLIVFQGQFDTSCPPSQSEMLVAKAKEAGVPVTLVVEKGGHEACYGAPELWSFLDSILRAKVRK